jgi:hypothetical protein
MWKLKFSLKMKLLIWFFNNKVLLTKDSLASRNSQGCKKFYFCDSYEIIEYLFHFCPSAHIVWRIVYISYNINPPINSTNIFRNCLNGNDN